MLFFRTLILAQAGLGLDVIYLGKVAIIVAGVIGIVLLIVAACGVTIPQVVWRVLGILGLVVLGLIVLTFLARFL